MMLIGDKVLVFEGGCVGRTVFDQAAESTAFEVIDACDIILIIKPQSVPHENQMHLLIVLHFDGVNAVDARYERISVLFEMGVELGQDILQ